MSERVAEGVLSGSVCFVGGTAANPTTERLLWRGPQRRTRCQPHFSESGRRSASTRLPHRRRRAVWPFASAALSVIPPPTPRGEEALRKADGDALPGPVTRTQVVDIRLADDAVRRSTGPARCAVAEGIKTLLEHCLGLRARSDRLREDGRQHDGHHNFPGVVLEMLRAPHKTIWDLPTTILAERSRELRQALPKIPDPGHLIRSQQMLSTHLSTRTTPVGKLHIASAATGLSAELQSFRGRRPCLCCLGVRAMQRVCRAGIVHL